MSFLQKIRKSPRTGTAWAFAHSDSDAIIVIPPGTKKLANIAIQLGDVGQPTKMVGNVMSGNAVSEEVGEIYLKAMPEQQRLSTLKTILVVFQEDESSAISIGTFTTEAKSPIGYPRPKGKVFGVKVREVIDFGEGSGIWRGWVSTTSQSRVYLQLEPAVVLRKDQSTQVAGYVDINASEVVTFTPHTWLPNLARFKLFAETFVYFQAVSRTRSQDDASAADNLHAILLECAGMNNVRLQAQFPIPPLILPVGSEKLNEHRIEYHALKVREATTKPNIDYSAPANLNLDALKRIPAKGIPWEGDFNETMACIVIQTSSKKAPEEATLVILKDYVLSSDGIPSRMFLENIYKDGRRENLLLGEGPQGIADKISPAHAILVVKGDVHNHDTSRKGLYAASVRFA